MGSIERMLRTDRSLLHVEPPLWEALPHELAFDSYGVPLPSNIKAHFAREGLLFEEDALELVTRCASIMKRESTLLRVQGSAVICGDLHGQFFDLLKLFELGGEPGEQQYIFLGDYVDRGSFGVEVVLLFMAYKICHPGHFFLIRGNHESRHLTSYFNFKREVEYKYSLELYEEIMSAFDCLPLACLLNSSFLCVHGGLSPEIRHLEDIDLIHRFREPPSSGPMCDLLWSDPIPEYTEEATLSGPLFSPNTIRGCSYSYSHEAVCRFLEANGLLGLIRGHEAQTEGYHLYANTSMGVPATVCVFSAPNYCDTYNNRAAFIYLDGDVMKIRQYNSSSHPYYLPNFINAFTWSFPFMVTKMCELWSKIIGTSNESDPLVPVLTFEERMTKSAKKK
ncbi:serine/threonine protein phosphatase [Trypanosoma rangeli SC58]|uniref:Serine/threonine-protein phosphatase n=1 Tax=Trypanosoma rangeli SC58 TaxID=429131 RepID=A0A061J4R5_TRYRA|nr:serine/threonine protein phosphatase [Trypanosoma rangeli SC58]